MKEALPFNGLEQAEGITKADYQQRQNAVGDDVNRTVDIEILYLYVLTTTDINDLTV